jgi:hypothetical protein
VNVGEPEELMHEHGVLIDGAGLVGGDPPVAHQLLFPVHSEHGVGVSDVDDQEHKVREWLKVTCRGAIHCARSLRPFIALPPKGLIYHSPTSA